MVQIQSIAQSLSNGSHQMLRLLLTCRSNQTMRLCKPLRLSSECRYPPLPNNNCRLFSTTDLTQAEIVKCPPSPRAAQAQGLAFRPTAGEGNCMFDAICDQMWMQDNTYSVTYMELRQQCAQWLRDNYVVKGVSTASLSLSLVLICHCSLMGTLRCVTFTVTKHALATTPTRTISSCSCKME